MDPAFKQAIEDLRIMQERANEQHRIAMAEAKARLATLDEEHARAMAEADARLAKLGYEEEARKVSSSSTGSNKRSKEGEGERGGRGLRGKEWRSHDEAMAEADQRLRNLTAQGAAGSAGGRD